MKAVYLEITSWVGTAINAEHWMGCLQFRGASDIELTHPLTSGEARRLTVKSRGAIPYEKGEMSEKFESKQQLIDCAIASYKTHFPDADMLVLGRRAILDPQPVLDGPEPVKSQINAMVARAEVIDYYDGGHEAEMNQISDAFGALMRGAK